MTRLLFAFTLVVSLFAAENARADQTYVFTLGSAVGQYKVYYVNDGAGYSSSASGITLGPNQRTLLLFKNVNGNQYAEAHYLIGIEDRAQGPIRELSNLVTRIESADKYSGAQLFVTCKQPASVYGAASLPNYYYYMTNSAQYPAQNNCFITYLLNVVK